MVAALCCVATMVIPIPVPGGGYINPGDAVVLLGAFLLGPVWGSAAASIGSALADCLTGYAIYAPGTFVIKALMALIAGLLMRRLNGRHPAAACIVSGLAAEAVMVGGYFFYSAVVLGVGLGALISIPGDCIQGVFGIICSCLLFLALHKVSYIRSLTE